jgi:hypothetical protein
MRVGEDLRQLDGFGKYDRLAQGLAHRVVGQRKPGSERQWDHTAKERSPCGQQQQPSAQDERRDVQHCCLRAGETGTGDSP